MALPNGNLYCIFQKQDKTCFIKAHKTQIGVKLNIHKNKITFNKLNYLYKYSKSTEYNILFGFYSGYL